MNARRFTAHRALPLDVVEARERAARVAWPNGIPPAASPRPAAAPIAAAPLRKPPQPKPPAYPWRALGTGLLVAFVALGCFHAFVTIYEAAPLVAAR